MANYKIQRFSDPKSSGGPKLPKSQDFRRLVHEYLRDPLFAFDEDHAAIALPINCVIEAREKLGMDKIFTDLTDFQYIRQLLTDRFGAVTPLISAFADC